MPNMDWEKVRREELRKHDDVTLRTGKRQGIAESGPSSDGTPTRAELRQARIQLLYAFDDCARVGCSIRLQIGRSKQVLAFDNAERQREFPIDVIGHSPSSPIDATVRCEAPKEVATALRYRHSPKYWWPPRLEIQSTTVAGISTSLVSFRVEESGTPAIRVPIGDLVVAP